MGSGLIHLIETCATFKPSSKRDSVAAIEALEAISDGARSNQNMFPLVIDAVKLDCTLGEIMSAMKEVFGTYMAPSGF